MHTPILVSGISTLLWISRCLNTDIQTRTPPAQVPGPPFGIRSTFGPAGYRVSGNRTPVFLGRGLVIYRKLGSFGPLPSYSHPPSCFAHACVALDLDFGTPACPNEQYGLQAPQRASPVLSDGDEACTQLWACSFCFVPPAFGFWTAGSLLTADRPPWARTSRGRPDQS